ncbi:MAG: glyoxalase superfamily protein [Longimicrobiales bacterium]
MSIRRVVPDIASRDLGKSREFYEDFLGFELAMDMGWIMTFVSPANPTAQISVVEDMPARGRTPGAALTIEVADVDAVHARAVDRNMEIVYPLTDEPWGVRRFFVRDPNGTVINVMSHLA